MKLYFCDLCNESVPHSDLELGKAFIRKSRVVCASCDEAMSAALASQASEGKGSGEKASNGAPPPGPSQSEKPSGAGATPVAAGAQANVQAGTQDSARDSSGGERPVQVRRRAASLEMAALWLALIALLLSAGTVMYVLEELKRVQGEQENTVEAVREDARMRIMQSSEEQSLAREELRVSIQAFESELASDRTRSQAELASLAEKLTAFQLARDTLRQDLDKAIADSGKKVALQDGQLSEFDAELERFAAELRFFGERLNELEVSVLTGEYLAEAEGVVMPKEPQQGAAWASILDDLQSEESGDRWAAVQALGETNDTNVVPHLLPILKDSDIFVRMATARVLGDLGSSQAVPYLIDALEDVEVAVQEAAVGSLRSITGRKFGFEIEGTERDRAKGIKAWRSWWEKSGEKAAPAGE